MSMVKELKFKDEFYLPIKNGDKISTIRNERKNIEVGEKVYAVFENEELEPIRLEIWSITEKPFFHIGKVDARMEGYQNWWELTKSLVEIYPDLKNNPNAIIYIYEFRVNIPCLTRLFDELSSYVYSLNYEIEGLEEELTKDMTNLESRELRGHLKNVKAEREALTRLLERYK